MLVLLFIIASASLALPVTNAAFNCSVCALDNSYNQSNGYGCFQFNDGNVACTCPDQRYTLNKACRICERTNICGDDPKNICAETSLESLGIHRNNSQYFVCFCPEMNMGYVVEGACAPTLPITAAPPLTPVVADPKI